MSARGHGRRAAVAGTSALTAMLLVVSAGCGVTHDEHAREIARGDVLFGLANPTTTTTTLPPTTVPPPPPTTTTVPDTTTTVPTTALLLYFASGAKLVNELRTVTLPPGTTANDEALNQLVAGPTRADQQTLIAANVLVSLEVRGGTAQVGLGPVYFGLSADQQVLALGQVVLTLTARPGIGKVLFLINGDQPADVFRGDGTPVRGEVSADDYAPYLHA